MKLHPLTKLPYRMPGSWKRYCSGCNDVRQASQCRKFKSGRWYCLTCKPK